MVSDGKCLGIKHENSLVSWCLTYDEGSLGMLYTLQVIWNKFRLKGFVTCCVLLVRNIEGKDLQNWSLLS